VVRVRRVAVIGAGYVGLTTAACHAHLGHDVVCVDIDREKIALLRQGLVPFLEHGVDDLVNIGLQRGNLRFDTDLAAAAAASEFVFVCVPTPQRSDGSADLNHIEAAVSAIAEAVPPGAIVVNKSTVPVGSTRIVERTLNRPDVHVVSNPEFLREGTAVHDFLQPDRVVIGADDRSAAGEVAALYAAVEAPTLVTDPASAETIKYAANAFLATKISFVNAVAAVCEAVGADVSAVIQGIGYDRRIGHEFLCPGPGWGGSCFPKDTAALIRIAEDAGYDFNLLRGVIAVNDEQRERIVGKVARAAGGSLVGARIGVWGLAFKAGTDDIRESPALAVIARLQDEGAEVVAYDPCVARPPAWVSTVADPYAACEQRDALVVLTEWDEFCSVDIDKVASLMSGREVVDARNVLERASWQRAGFAYQGVGR
jgi:UDPglucose 6-dehydrogenase